MHTPLLTSSFSRRARSSGATWIWRKAAALLVGEAAAAGLGSAVFRAADPVLTSFSWAAATAAAGAGSPLSSPTCSLRSASSPLRTRGSGRFRADREGCGCDCGDGDCCCCCCLGRARPSGGAVSGRVRSDRTAIRIPAHATEAAPPISTANTRMARLIVH